MSDKRADLKTQMETFLEGAITFAPSDCKGCFINVRSAMMKLEAITALSDAGEAEQGEGEPCTWERLELNEARRQLAEVTKERDMLIEGLDDIHANLRTILDSAPRSAGQTS